MIKSVTLSSRKPISEAGQTRGSGLFYGLIKVVLFITYKVLFNFKYYGREHVPQRGQSRGVILAPNHASYLDPPLLGISLKRRVTYLAKDYLFKSFFVGLVLRGIGAYPIKTQAQDFRSIRDLIRILAGGRCVVVFPEGTRSPDGKIQEPESGVGFLAMKSRAAVVPVYIDGTFEAFPKGAKKIRRHPVKIYYGEAFIPAEDAGLVSAADPYVEVSKRIMSEIAKLKHNANRGS